MSATYHSYMVRALAILSLALGASLSASASPIYTFSYTGLGGTFQNTTITIPESSFLTANALGTSYAITGSLTDGTTTWTFTKLVIAASGPNSFCVVLGTSALTPNGCGGFNNVSGASQGEIITSYSNLGGIPTANGSFSQPGASFFGFNSSNGFVGITGNASLVISSSAAPEPGSLLFAGTAMLLFGLVFRRRLVRP
jgi:hypothetical protein